MRLRALYFGFPFAVAVVAVGLSLPRCVEAQSAMEPSASSMIKSTINKSDPIKLLLDRKKLLDLNKTQEDTLKSLGKEMRHMQDVVFEDIDRAARKEKDNDKQGGDKPKGGAVSDQIQERIKRLQDIQSAYRDRALGFLTPVQRTKADSLDNNRKPKDEKKPGR